MTAPELRSTGGGQPRDTGILAGACVVDVQKPGARVWPDLDGPLPTIGATVRGTLDWERRRQLMRTHTAMHILCGAIWNMSGTAVTGGNIEPRGGRMDFEFDPFPDAFAETVERAVNDVIAVDYPIAVSFLPRTNALEEADLLRTKVNLIPESVTEIRLVDIVGFDQQGDGGTHVHSTGELGRFRVLRTENRGTGNKRPRIAVEDG